MSLIHFFNIERFSRVSPFLLTLGNDFTANVWLEFYEPHWYRRMTGSKAFKNTKYKHCFLMGKQDWHIKYPKLNDSYTHRSWIRMRTAISINPVGPTAQTLMKDNIAQDTKNAIYTFKIAPISLATPHKIWNWDETEQSDNCKALFSLFCTVSIKIRSLPGHQDRLLRLGSVNFQVCHWLKSKILYLQGNRRKW